VDSHKTLQVLKGARALISDPTNWVRGMYKRPKFDPEKNEFVTGYCSIGAVCKSADDVLGVYGAVDTFERYRLVGAATNVLKVGVPWNFDGGITVFNDYSSHERVLSLFDGAIARVEGQLAKTKPVAMRDSHDGELNA
jgi:hypothetical protein